MPCSAPTLVSCDCALASSQFEATKPPSLLRVRIADHHLLHVALPMGGAADQRHGQRLAHDGGRGAEIGDGLEQRHDRQRADLGAGRIEKRAALLGQQIGAENVVDRARHRQDERAERVAVEPAPGLGRLARTCRSARTASAGSCGISRGPVERPRQLAEQPCAPFAAAELGRAVVAVAGGRPPQRLQARRWSWWCSRAGRADGGEAEDLDRAAHRLDQIGGERGAVRLVAARARSRADPGSARRHWRRPRRAADILPSTRAMVASSLRSTMERNCR